MNTQKGVIHLVVPLLLLLIIGGGVFLLSYLGVVKIPALPFLNLFQKKPSVELKKDYKNPFNKESQYVNPFETYKNPFATNK